MNQEELKAAVMRVKQECIRTGIVRMDAVDLSMYDKQYHDIIIHGVCKGTNTKGWHDYFQQEK